MIGWNENLHTLGPPWQRLNIPALHREGLKSCCMRKVPLLKKTHAQACLKFAKKHLDDLEEAWEKVMWSDETKIELFGINSTHRVWRKRNAEYNPRTPSPLWSMEVETLCFGGVSQLRGQDDFPVSWGGWMGPCTGTFWATTSFPQWEHWKWVVDGSSQHDNEPKTYGQGNKGVAQKEAY